MRSDDIEEAGFVLGVAKATQVLNTGSRKCHGSKTQNRGCDFVFIAQRGEGLLCLGDAHKVESRREPFRDVTGMVVPCGKFQIKTRSFVFLSGVLDAQIGKTDLALNHRKL